jgi:Ni,Fe-hydrogenase III small subunit/formate hydrogenlyase subunit 6/NADH:ubiquinone oxidoreductase subunit I
MLKGLLARIHQGYQTTEFPAGEPPALPDRFRGRPVIDASKCEPACSACANACPTGAVAFEKERPAIDLGRCLFCPECESACPSGAITFTGEFRMAARNRGDLVQTDEEYRLASALDERLRRLFGRSLKLRVVSAGDCNGCNSDVNVLSTIGWDLGRFGIQYVASPRHADGVLITGPVTANMRLAVRKTYDAVPRPKIVIAVGVCAISGGPYFGLPGQDDGADGSFPVDLYVPGCPPHPLTILDGLLRLVGRIEAGER